MITGQKTRIRSIRTAIAAGLLWAFLPALFGTPGSAHAELAPAAEQFVEEHGPAYGLAIGEQGDLYYNKGARSKLAGLSRPKEPHGVALGRSEPKQFGSSVRPEPMRGAVLQRFTALAEKAQGRDPDEAFVPALKAMLRPGMGEGDSLNGEPLYAARGRTLALTALGRNIFMDILTATDADGVRGQWGGKQSSAAEPRESVIDRLKKEGQLTHLSEKAGVSGRFFDNETGAAPQAVHAMQSYGKWEDLAKNKAKDVYIDPVTGRMRLIVAAENAVAADRFKVLNGKERTAIYKETGLDKKLITRYGGKIVRAIDNLVEVDVSKVQAIRLGKALERRGIHSAPNLAVKLADAAGQGFARGRFPLESLLPFSRNIFSRLAGKEEVRAQSADSKDLLKAGSLWEKGMEGEGSIVGIVDSGLDMKHPDFKDRVLAYVDLVQAGKDGIGHGTHVAGLTGGDGAASEGRYKGMAPKAKFVVIQIFGASGAGASEMSILAAMKIISSLPAKYRPDVVNMSLGINPPMGNNLHSSSLMASWLMARHNIFMAIAGGNSGPKQYTIGAPGNSRHVLTVTGTDKKGEFPFFPSRGPIVNWPFKEYNKPDVATIAGGVDRENPCPYAPGLVAARSGEENFPAGRGEQCKLPDNANYRYMSGTSMATPLAAGIAADVIGYLKSKGIPYTTAEVKALIMETADDLGQPAYVQGAGLVNGERLAKTLEERAAAGAAAGNVALMLSREATPFQKWYLQERKGIVTTAAGLLDTRSGHLINTDMEIDALRTAVDREFSAKNLLERVKLKVQFKLASNKATEEVDE